MPPGVTTDLDGNPRFVDDPATPDTGFGSPPIVDMGVYESQYQGPADCNGNGIPDECDIDCGEPGGPCDVPGCGQSEDLNGNGVPDECEVQCEANEMAKLLASDGTTEDLFGWSVAVSGDVAVVGARDDGAGSAYVLRSEAENWLEEAKLQASDGAEGDYFGCSVTIDGDTVIVGAYRHGCCGAAYVFQRDHGGPDNWGEVVKLTGSDGYNNDDFGYSVAIDGDIAIVGIRGDDDGPSPAGAAYIFMRDYGGPGNWGEFRKLTASDAGGYFMEFGNSVSIDGDTVIVGAHHNRDDGPRSGSAYVFQRSHGGADNWGEVVKLTASDAAEYDLFGASVAVSGDFAIVGAHHNDDGGSNAGSAYLFQRDHGGPDNWGEVVKLTAFDGGEDDNFGYAVGIGGDIAIVGAIVDGAGSAYVYRFDGLYWDDEAKLAPSDGAGNDLFGIAVAVYADSAAIGAARDDDNGSDSGSAYIFRGLSDCQANGTLDICDIAAGTSQDTNGNGVPDECETLPGDLDGDGDVDLSDLAQLLSNYGMTEGATYEDGDLDGDGDVDLSDLAALLANYGAGA